MSSSDPVVDVLKHDLHYVLPASRADVTSNVNISSPFDPEGTPKLAPPYIPTLSPLRLVYNPSPTLDSENTTSSHIPSMVTIPMAPSSRVVSPGDVDKHEANADSPALERLQLRLVSSFIVFFLCGWADGVTGTILPYLKHEFHLSYMTSSLLFVASAVGFGIGTLLIEVITQLLGRFSYSSPDRLLPFVQLPFASSTRSKSQSPMKPRVGQSLSQARYLTLICGSIIHTCFFIVMGTSRGFTNLLVAYVISAFGRSFLLASLNAYVASTPKRPLGYTLGCLSTGAFAAPLVCQSIMAAGVRWNQFYFGSLVLSAMNLGFIFFAFRPTMAELQRERAPHHYTPTSTLQNAITKKDNASLELGLGSPCGKTGETGTAFAPETNVLLLRRTLSTPYVWAFSLFALIYSGSESTTQGFMVTYLLAARHANPNTVGYVTSGFWAAMAFTRLAWGYSASLLSFRCRKYILHGCILIALIMHFTTWFINSFVQNAFAFVTVGLVYGPVFPGTLVAANDLVPTDIHMSAMAIISAFGSFGGALFPFVTGVFSNIDGPHVLPYVTVAQMATLVGVYFLFPSKVADPRRGQAST